MQHINAHRSPNQPTVFHITHPKAGSQWVAMVLKHCAPWRYVGSKVHMAQFREEPVKPGGVYGALFESRSHFEAILAPELDLDVENFKLSKDDDSKVHNWYHFQLLRKPYINFVVIRDLRDTLVSLYFSQKVSHDLLTERHRKLREMLNNLSQEEGLIYLINHNLRFTANIQLSWLEDDILLVKYENLVADEYAVFEQIVDYCQINVSRERLRQIVEQLSFKTVTGRKPGEEDVTAHHRKGVAGDWRNHFSDRVKEEFKQRFGDTLIETGYESDLNW